MIRDKVWNFRNNIDIIYISERVARSIRIPVIAWLLQGIPEQIAVVTLAFVIARIPLRWNKILLIGIFLAFFMYVVRLFPIPFGVHTVLQLFLLFLILTNVGKGDIGLYFIACLVSFLALLIFEFSYLLLFMLITGYTPETIFNDLMRRIVVGEPQVLLLFISAFIINKILAKRGLNKSSRFEKQL